MAISLILVNVLLVTIAMEIFLGKHSLNILFGTFDVKKIRRKFDVHFINREKL